MPNGLALVACDPWAACIMASHSTADRLGHEDSAALWTAMSWAKPGEPVLVGLPAFGGDPREARELPSALSDLGRSAAGLAASFYPPSDWHDDDDGYDEDAARAEQQWLEQYWANNDTHYRWFMEERARGVRWLSSFRPALIRELATRSATNADRPSSSTMKVTRHGGFAILRNEAGGRLGKVQQAVRLPHDRKVRDHAKPDYVNVLLLASEHDRPAAVAAYADIGIEFPFDPTPGWLDAAVEPAHMDGSTSPGEAQSVECRSSCSLRPSTFTPVGSLPPWRSCVSP